LEYYDKTNTLKVIGKPVNLKEEFLKE